MPLEISFPILLIIPPAKMRKGSSQIDAKGRMKDIFMFDEMIGRFQDENARDLLAPNFIDADIDVVPYDFFFVGSKPPLVAF